jgi:prophage antirepressor-like protein
MKGRELLVFNNEEFGNIRVINQNDNTWFVAKDVAIVLGYESPQKMYQRLELDEKINIDPQSKEYQGLCQDGVSLEPNINVRIMTLINESGLYNAIFGSILPEAKKFKKWVTSEVLPTIRKTGGYVANEDIFVETYLPFADNETKTLFKSTLTVIRNQNEIIHKQQKEIEHKEDVIIGLVDQISLAEKRQILNRVVRKCKNYQDRWNELYKQFEMKFHINLEKRFETYNLEHKPKLKNKLDYIDKVMNKIPELYEIAAKLYENDVKELVKELYDLQASGM